MKYTVLVVILAILMTQVRSEEENQCHDFKLLSCGVKLKQTWEGCKENQDVQGCFEKFLAHGQGGCFDCVCRFLPKLCSKNNITENSQSKEAKRAAEEKTGFALNLNTLINSVCKPALLIECGTEAKKIFEECKDSTNKMNCGLAKIANNKCKDCLCDIQPQFCSEKKVEQPKPKTEDDSKKEFQKQRQFVQQMLEGNNLDNAQKVLSAYGSLQQMGETTSSSGKEPEAKQEEPKKEGEKQGGLNSIIDLLSGDNKDNLNQGGELLKSFLGDTADINISQAASLLSLFGQGGPTKDPEEENSDNKMKLGGLLQFLGEKEEEEQEDIEEGKQSQDEDDDYLDFSDMIQVDQQEDHDDDDQHDEPDEEHGAKPSSESNVDENSIGDDTKSENEGVMDFDNLTQEEQEMLAQLLHQQFQQEESKENLEAQKVEQQTLEISSTLKDLLRGDQKDLSNKEQKCSDLGIYKFCKDQIYLHIPACKNTVNELQCLKDSLPDQKCEICFCSILKVDC